MMEIFYEVHEGLYVNLTNKCPCACTFCLRQTMDKIGNSSVLWLDHDAGAQEALEAMKKWDLSKYTELVFCGFGEPTEALDVLKVVAAAAKKQYNIPVRINTNGLGNLVNGRDIIPELVGLVDTVSISLNTPNAKEYYELVRPQFGEKSFDAMLDFARESAQKLPHVVMTTVDTTLSKEDEDKCRKICEDLGVTYRIRPWED